MNADSIPMQNYHPEILASAYETILTIIEAEPDYPRSVERAFFVVKKMRENSESCLDDEKYSFIVPVRDSDGRKRTFVIDKIKKKAIEALYELVMNLELLDLPKHQIEPLIAYFGYLNEIRMEGNS